MRWLIIAIVILALACAWFVPWPARAENKPYFRAVWDTATSATIVWHQSQRGCLSVLHQTGERVFIGCWEKWPQTVTVELGGPGTDGAFRPQSHDIYFLESGEQIYSAPLRGRPVYLPLVR